jgi:HlyD family secretion protein
MRNHLWTLAMAAVLCLAGCGDRSTTSSASDTRDAPELRYTEPTPFVAQRRDVVGYEFLHGKLIVPPEAQGVAYAPYVAPVERVLTSLGQRVRRGEVLAQLSAPEAEIDYEQARADVKAAETALSTAKAQADVNVRPLRQQVSTLRARERELRQTTDPSGDASSLVAATEERRAAQAQLDQAQAEADQQVLPYKQQLEQMRARLKQAQAGAKQANVEAPISGTVVELNAKSGETTVDRQPVATIVDLEALRIQGEPDPEQAGILKKGMRAVMKFQGLPDQPFEGIVQGIRTLPDEGSIDRILEIKLVNTKGLIKPGMTLDSIAVETGKVENAVAIPVQALDKDETGKPYIQVMIDQKWVKRVVEPGLSDGEYVEIRSGLKEGETVLVTP